VNLVSNRSNGKEGRKKEEHMMNPGAALISGAGMGALLMYLLDPDRGRRRRAMIQDQATKASRNLTDAADATTRDMRNRGAGLWWELQSWFTGQPIDEDDTAVQNRVRSNLGMLVRHPRSIDVRARQGRVTLAGPILQDEVDHTIRTISRIPGVHQVDNRLEIHSKPDGIPGLQGDLAPRRPRFELMQVNWSPAARLMTGAAGTVLAILGLRRRGLAGTGMTAVGAGFLTRGLTNREFSRYFNDKRNQDER
jgi:osmotically-inducible protein OsmY